jgi:hypothetical protein
MTRGSHAEWQYFKRTLLKNSNRKYAVYRRAYCIEDFLKDFELSLDDANKEM